ncbi:zinc finger protein CONSTANS-LIKE 5 [Castanea sativa]|uniref:zinc finger protein CONSTANS-LIKE 5 n=1 Tax=Castanea sativa TaxID=21020 RepID=UPI003F64B0F6
MGIEATASSLKTWGVAAKLCDTCKSGSAALFCRVDSVFLCLTCDSKLHSRHERVWMCEVCEQAPASVTCKADAAALCVTCDSDIHSANPLARRHERVPVEPFFDSADSVIKSAAPLTDFLVVPTDHNESPEAGSWVLPNPSFVEDPDVKPTDLLFTAEMDPFLDFEYPNSFHNSGTDSVVPVQAKPVSAPVSETCFDIEFCKSKLSAFNYPSHSLSQSVSSSEVGVVPDGNSMSDISYPFGRNMSVDPNVPVSGTTAQAATQLCGTDREARVLRYREKRKNRKFEKTIRYASRKAYAETRPRIKGRFAKRTEMIESDVDSLFNSVSTAAFITEAQYGVVPTF